MRLYPSIQHMVNDKAVTIHFGMPQMIIQMILIIQPGVSRHFLKKRLILANRTQHFNVPSMARTRGHVDQFRIVHLQQQIKRDPLVVQQIMDAQYQQVLNCYPF